MVKNFGKKLFKPINPAGTILLGMYTLTWGFWLATPRWQVFTEADLYTRMDELAPEWMWGVGAMIVGLAILYGAIRPSYRSLLVGSALGFLQWGMSSLMYFMGNWQNTGGITSMFIAMYCLYIYTNVKVNRIGTAEQQLDSANSDVLD